MLLLWYGQLVQGATPHADMDGESPINHRIGLGQSFILKGLSRTLYFFMVSLNAVLIDANQSEGILRMHMKYPNYSYSTIFSKNDGQYSEIISNLLSMQIRPAILNL